MEEESTTTFEQDGTTYELVYAAKRVDMIESVLGNRSILDVFGGAPSMRDLRTLAAYGMREVGSTAWVNPGKALSVCGDYIEEKGIATLMELASTAVMRDCGFLFR
ncbi:hypothetical protein [Olsenella uli]|uniref:hypothetical protein n=1 Tax=Olsenella uli TaxID=133926 RepID=UPI0028EE0606|nr:hypothetical protein [Olsenella uli]